MNKARKNDWVEIENIVLTPDERAPQVPDDTKATPLMMWIKGFLMDDEASIGDEVSVKTLSGRIVKGKLVEINPRHVHDFGNPVHELLEIGMELKEN
ncbi:MAG: 2-amino-4-ketopentanoate thiolase [Tissierellia bacterium]|nr:2-amino-4-ketopentanoate thiolase [Tissierellia bacterium]